MPTRRLAGRGWFAEDQSLGALLDEYHNADELEAVMVEDADHLWDLLGRSNDDYVVIHKTHWRLTVLIAVLLILFCPTVENLLGHPILTGDGVRVLHELLEYL